LYRKISFHNFLLFTTARPSPEKGMRPFLYLSNKLNRFYWCFFCSFLFLRLKTPGTVFALPVFQRVRETKKFNLKKEGLIMKTKNFIVCGLICFLVFSPLLNLEGWAMLRPKPIMQAEPSPKPSPVAPIFIPVCFPFGDEICCEIYRCDPDMTTCVLLGDAPFCAPESSSLK
jgi:hypothetical protein